MSERKSGFPTVQGNWRLSGPRIAVSSGASGRCSLFVRGLTALVLNSLSFAAP